MSEYEKQSQTIKYKEGDTSIKNHLIKIKEFDKQLPEINTDCKAMSTLLLAILDGGNINTLIINYIHYNKQLHKTNKIYLKNLWIILLNKLYLYCLNQVKK